MATAFLSGCSYEEEVEERQFVERQYDMFRKTSFLYHFSFTGSPSPRDAMENIAYRDAEYTLEIFPSEEEAEKKYDLWIEVKGTIYVVPTELTYEKIDYLNEELKYKIEAMKEKGYSYPITIDDFVNDLDKIFNLFYQENILPAGFMDSIILMGDIHDRAKRKEQFGIE